MKNVVVPVRYPLSLHSKRTLSEAITIAEQNEAPLTVLHVNLYQGGKRISRKKLKQAVEAEFGRLPNVRYAVRTGFLVEETILNEIVAEDADVVVIGHKLVSRWRKVLRRLYNEPDVESYLRQRLSCEIVTVSPNQRP
jgi:nucleotide-binding universal stress UspA family protein